MLLFQHIQKYTGFLYNSRAAYTWLYYGLNYFFAFCFYIWISKKSFFKFWHDGFSSSSWLSLSAVVDYAFFFIYKFAIIDFILGWKLDSIDIAIKSFFESSSPGIYSQFSQNWGAQALWSICFLFITDFSKFLPHFLSHRIRFLWRFHAVHHSASDLNLLTISRIHPVEHIFQGVMAAPIIGAFLWLSVFLFGTKTLHLVLLGIPLYKIFVPIGIIQHSRFWIYFPNWLSHILVSPAMHQIHHSQDPRQHHKNFANIFSCFDWALGTLYIPRPDEVSTLRIGLAVDQKINPRSLWSCFWQPIMNCLNDLKSKKATYTGQIK